ncbi:hypothetical protein AGMMS5026_03030 [Endomicrobiia bacterium]|nr:hypothetical protein AGMMS49523_06630 [Endomicrobiia bacterium]GMO53393.1 MAG: hypothetical protein Ta2C_04880 [Candidatus Endomicrobium trichonymphae]GHT13452.1 hypothetical protein AGMMS49571_07210 [Endomicrobiia bacterium]GHT20865.1 hypothetical protein AGMMS49929_08580 [Endomicrobiia bacterium]GHT23800.1 hypothetical protein AGMMS49953_05010 [Endomicrobiia bacterium]
MRPKSRNGTAVPEVYVRCNHCLGCLKDKAQELSQRMSDEAVHFTDSGYVNAC